MSVIIERTPAKSDVAASPTKRRRHVWRTVRRTIGYVGIIWVILVFIFPMWVALDTSFKPANQQRTFPSSLLSTQPTIEKYVKAFGPLNFPHYMGTRSSSRA